MGCKLTTSYGCTAVPIAAPKSTVLKKKRTLLPVLTVLFLFSYGLMTLLIVEQGRAIQNQHNVIQVLMRDSTELWSAKGKALHQKALDAQAAQASASDSANGKALPAQTPSDQAQANKKQSNSLQRHSHGKAKPDLQAPPTPATDVLDQTRSLRTI